MTISLHTSNQNNFQQQDKPTDFLTFRPLISAFPRVPSTILEVEAEVNKMPKYFCDYCDTYLTHDSPSVRKTHCSGR